MASPVGTVSPVAEAIEGAVPSVPGWLRRLATSSALDAGATVAMPRELVEYIVDAVMAGIAADWAARDVRVAELEAARDRAVREAARWEQICHARWEVARRLRGALAVAAERAAVAERQRDEAQLHLPGHVVQGDTLVFASPAEDDDVSVELDYDGDPLVTDGIRAYDADGSEQHGLVLVAAARAGRRMRTAAAIRRMASRRTGSDR